MLAPQIVGTTELPVDNPVTVKLSTQAWLAVVSSVPVAPKIVNCSKSNLQRKHTLVVVGEKIRK